MPKENDKNVANNPWNSSPLRASELKKRDSIKYINLHGDPDLRRWEGRAGRGRDRREAAMENLFVAKLAIGRQSEMIRNVIYIKAVTKNEGGTGFEIRKRDRYGSLNMVTKILTDDTEAMKSSHKEGLENNDAIKKSDSKDLNKINSLKTNAGHDQSEIIAHFSKDDVTERVKFEGLDDESICSSEVDEEKLPPIPDGGWGWVVVLAAFLVSACADGLAFSFGLLHEEFTRYFETTQSKTALIGGFFIATPLLAGPVMSALVDRYGCRTMTILAGILSTIGFLLASVSDSIPMLCLTLGFLSGLAMGILYVTAVVSVAFWFDKKRNLAVSLASCGIGVGTLIYSPLTNYLLEVYDWRNTVVLLAGTLLNMCICGALMREPEWLKIKQKRERLLSRSRRSSSAGSISSRSIGGESVFLSPEELKSLLKSGKSPDYILATLATSIAEAEQLDATTKLNAEQTYKRMHSAVHLPTFVQQNEKVPVEVIEKLMNNKRLYNIILENYPSLLKVRSHSEVQLNVEPAVDAAREPVKTEMKLKITKSKNEPESGNKMESKSHDKHEMHIHDNPMIGAEKKMKEKSEIKPKEHHTTKSDIKFVSHPKDWFSRQISTDHHYLRGMPLYRNTIMYRGAMMNIPRYKLKASSLPDIYKNSTWSLGTVSDDEFKWHERFWIVFKKTFDFRMFTEFHFFMFNLSSLILSVWFIVPYYFLVTYMNKMEIDGAPTLISIIGIASSIGIVILGWIGDRPWANVTKIYAVCLIICGASVALYPCFIRDFWVLTVISAVFGLSFASSYSYTPAILMELMPLDHFTLAYGMILLSQGIGHLVGPSLGALLYDLSGTWDLTFYVGSAWIVVSGLCVGVIAFTRDVRLCGSAPLLKEEADRISKDLSVNSEDAPVNV
ncbi:Monocarboxylate transporter 12 [Eumeta japonica]|uniref:Monocarboxylate transporter 12 n=1 Tax=Eumeta variegata TaxID=151549 RepID=A0A4C1XAH2_EUMVA|nr:Monocarboxylate transporter 12 [Eumeta japonica]